MLKSLIIKKNIDSKQKELAEVRSKLAEIEKRESELEADLEKAATEEEISAVQLEADKLEAEKNEADEKSAQLETEIGELENELAEVETKQAESRKCDTKTEKREDVKIMFSKRRTKFFGMTVEERAAFFANDEVKAFLERTREFGRSSEAQTRTISGADLLIPEVMLELIRENIEDYSKLVSKVNLKSVPGKSRQTIAGTIPEAVWTEACASLKELDFGFRQTEVDGYKVGGYIAICNALLEDSDINLGTEIMLMLTQAIAFALDKAILYGTGTKMPLGILPRLAQTAKPSGYSNNDRTWVDLHTTNIISIAASSKATTLYQELITAASAASSKYAHGDMFFVMNKKTKAYLTAQALTINAAGAIVSGQNNTMPVIGGEIIELDFVEDNVIICGYGENFLLAQRAGTTLAQSSEVKFIEDQTVFKGTARYDGKPVIAEAFCAIGLNGVTPSATAVTFPT